MSVELCKNAFSEVNFDTAAMKMVFLVLCLHADDEFKSKITIPEIAKLSCMTYDGAYKNIRKLRDAGWITSSKKSPKHGNIYTINKEKFGGEK